MAATRRKSPMETLTKTQRELWDRIRHAVPAGLYGRTHVGWADTQELPDGTVACGTNLTATVEALAKAGAVEVVKVGGSLADVVRVLKDKGARIARVGPVETHPARVGAFVRVSFPLQTGYAGAARTFALKHSRGGSAADPVRVETEITREDIMAAYVAAGWAVEDGAAG